MHSLDAIIDSARRVYSAGQYLEAAKLYRRAIQLVPDGRQQLPFYLHAADALTEAESYFEAIDDCRSALAIDPDSPIAWRLLGRVLMELGQYSSAERALHTSLKLDSSPTTCIYLSTLYSKQGQLEIAEEYCRQAVELDCAFDEAHFNLGCILRDLGRLEDAISAFRAALSLSPEYGLAHRELGATLLELGYVYAANLHLRLSIDIMPSDQRANQLLMRLNLTEEN